MNGNRPNFSPPRDNISYWLRSGRPGWDPVTQDGPREWGHAGAVYERYRTSRTISRVPIMAPRQTGPWAKWYIGRGGLDYISAQGTASNAASPESGSSGPRLFSSNSAPGAASGVQNANQPLFASVPTISDKSLYDWESVNLAAVNRVMDRTLTGAVQLDQVFLNTQRQTIALQVAYMREDSQRYNRNLIGTANDNGISGQLFVDVNERKLDGTPNSYFGMPYVGVAQPWTRRQPLRYDTTRAQLAYRLDLSREKNLLRWLGTHQFSGYDEFKYRTSRTRTYRDAIVDDHPWIPAGMARGSTSNPFSVRAYTRFYMGDNVGSGIDYAPTDFAYGTYNFLWGNVASGKMNYEPVRIGEVASNSSTSGTKTILKTKGGMVQSHFIDDRIVTTFGIRQDGIYSKSGAPNQLNPDGVSFGDSVNHWAVGDYSYRSGKTKQGGVVVRPFRGWGFIKRMDGGGVSHFLAETLNGLSLTYNRSDSFTPQSPAQDILLNLLPNTTGIGTDYGIALNMFDSKFVLRINKFETLQKGVSGGDANTLSRRVLKYDVPNPADEPVYMLYIQASDWTKALHPTWTDAQIDDEVAKITQIPIATRLALDIQDPGLNARNTQLSKGYEVELNFNPTRYWTLAASGTDTQSYVSGAGTSLATWIDMRMPIWTTIKDPRGPDHVLGTPDDAPVSWWTTNYGGNQTAAQNYALNVGAPFSLLRQQEGKPRTQLRRYNAKFSTKFDLAGFTEHRILKRFNVGGSVRWADKAAIGFYGVQSLPDPITELDGNRPIYDKAQYYVDAFFSYRTKLWGDRMGATFQFNARNIQEGGRLQAIGVDPDGTPKSYRIVDPRQFIFTATFDF